ncbi:uncharacterized protein LOC100377383 [Saccoglossus kowalevskii]
MIIIKMNCGYFLTQASVCYTSISITMSMCINCGNAFEVKAKGYKRHSLVKQVGKVECVKDALDEVYETNLTPLGHKSDAPRCLCQDCYALLEKSRRKIREGKEAKQGFFARCAEGTYLHLKRKRCTPTRTPRTLKKHRNVEDADENHYETAKKLTFVKRVILAVKRHDYESAISILYHRSVRARKQIATVISNKVRKEVGNYIKKSRPMTLSKETCESFQWEKIIEEVNCGLPLLTSIIRAALTTQRSHNLIDIRSDGSCGKLTPAYGMIMCNLLHLRKRRKFNIIQAFNSIQMYKSGCSQKLFKCFQHVGICLGVNGTRGTIDRMRKNFDKEMYDMKSKIEEELRDDAPNISSDDGDIDVAFGDVDNMDSRPNVHTTDGS